LSMFVSIIKTYFNVSMVYILYILLILKHLKFILSIKMSLRIMIDSENTYKLEHRIFNGK